MERISSKLQEYFPATTLYLDDVIEVIDAFDQACDRIEITAGEYKITSPTELDELASKFTNDRFDNLKIQGYDPYVSLELRSFGARTYISEDSLEQRGLIAKAREVLDRCRRIRLHFLANAAYIVLCALATWQVFFCKNYYFGGLLMLVGFAMLPFSSHLKTKSAVIAYTRKRVDMKSFYERKKDDVLLAIISAALGAAASYAATKFLP